MQAEIRHWVSFWKTFAQIMGCLHKVRKEAIWVGFRVYGYDSMALCLGTGALAGALVILQTRLLVAHFGARFFLGWASGYAMLVEFGPLLLGFMMAARVGARHASELAWFRAGGQLTALRGMGIDVFRFWVTPRAFALFFSTVALLSGLLCVSLVLQMVAAELTLGLPWRVFLENFQTWTRTSDLLLGLTKTIAFAGLIAIEATRVGLAAEASSEGVGDAAATTVTRCGALLFVVDFLITRLWGGFS